MNETFVAGDVVRYADGCTALAQLKYPHAGGWHATQCMGGTLFVSDNGYRTRLVPATPEDYKTWIKNEKWRKQ